MKLFNFGRSDGGIMDAIRCDEDHYLIWKWHPKGSEEGQSKKANSIRWGSSLRVKDGQAALFVCHQNGKVEQEYICGPYDSTLKTDNLPGISKMVGMLYGGNTPFPAEIYFFNLSQIIQLRFGVPYFDIFDPRFQDCGVPVAVRGTINFCIANPLDFLRLNSLDNFNVDDFQMQIREAVVRYVKESVIRVPLDNNISVLQIESRISEINQLIENKVKKRLEEDFGVLVSGVDIAEIEIDKSSEDYTTLVELTKKSVREVAKLQNEIELEKLRNEKQQIKNAMSVGAVPPPLPQPKYYVEENGTAGGPYSKAILKQMVQSGRLTPNTLVWKQGMADWVEAGNENELRKLFE